jgi:uncharacterized protein involved in exopolysaccharide biosynthesis/Mrp family chromosome partitioning ATPase
MNTTPRLPPAGPGPDADEAQESASMRDVLHVLFRHKFKVVAFFLVVTLTALVVLAMSPSKYVSSARLLVQRAPERSLAVNPDSGFTPANRDWTSEVNSEVEILRSQELIEQLVDAIGLDNIVPPERPDTGRLATLKRRLKAVVQKVWSLSAGAGAPPAATYQDRKGEAIVVLTRCIQLEVLKSSDVIAVTATSEDPRLARRLVATLTDLYLAKRVQVRRTPGVRSFFTAQAEKLGKELMNTEAALNALNQEIGGVSLEVNNRSLGERSDRLQQDGSSVESDVRASAAKVQMLQLTLARSAFPGAGGAPLSPKAFEDASSALQTERATLASLLARQASITKQLALIRGQIDRLKTYETRIQDLQRERAQLETSVRNYATTIEKARIDEALEESNISNIRIVEAASAPLQPEPAQKPLKFAMALLFAIGGAVGLAFMSEQFDNTFRRPQDVTRRLGLRTLVAIPRVHSMAPSAARNRSVLAAIRRRQVRAGLAATRDPEDYFETLRHRLFAPMDPGESGPCLIGVTSCHGGEGVTAVALNLAHTIARHAGADNVIYLNANAREAGEGTTYLGDALVEPQADSEVSVMVRRVEQRLVAMEAIDAPGGGLREEVLPATTRFAAALRRIEERGYGFVVLDMPPLCEGAAAIQLARTMRAVVLVIEAEKTRWQVARNAVEQLRETCVEVAGAVLNKRRFYVPGWLYRRA